MAFFEELLLECIAYGATGGPTFNTRQVPMRNGRVLRNANWSRPRYRYTFSYSNIAEADARDVVAAFIVCQGAAHGFRWWDRADYTAVREELGVTTTSPQTLQLTKTYGFGSGALVRPIRKPRAAGFQIYVNSVPVSSVLDTTTGLVTVSVPPGGFVTWSGEFDVPVTFESDEQFWSFDNRTEHGYVLTSEVALIEDLTQ
jgi:uncharacterized protein (TIGR02217 family)